MNRSRFLVLAGVMATAFGAGMLIAPGAMLTNMARDTADARFVLQWMGVVLLSVGIINPIAIKAAPVRRKNSPDGNRKSIISTRR